MHVCFDIQNECGWGFNFIFVYILTLCVYMLLCILPLYSVQMLWDTFYIMSILDILNIFWSCFFFICYLLLKLYLMFFIYFCTFFLSRFFFVFFFFHEKCSKECAACIHLYANMFTCTCHNMGEEICVW